MLVFGSHKKSYAGIVESTYKVVDFISQTINSRLKITK